MYLMKCFSCLQLKTDENITKLDFSNNNLSEVFPQIWQYERTLEELILASARLNSLPPQLFYCQSLRVLVVSNNNLENIPSAIGSLRQLQHLNLYRNLISSVPETIKSCKNLTHLDLSCNNLQRLPDALTSVISLQELYLNETYMEFLPANFGRLINLRILELRLNNLVTLPKSMVRLINLQRMDIGGNEFTELPEVIGELKQLRELWIDLNQIRRICRNIAKLKELIHFEANGNLLERLPNEIFNLQKIEVLSICMNSLQTFPATTGSIKFLVTLKCESNELQSIPESISNLENLEELVLSHNHLRSLPASIGMLRKLRFLFVDDNLLDALPHELCSCSELRVLSVCNNRISELPHDIGHLGLLTVLNLVNNQISYLPVSVLSLTNLKSLWLSDNQSQPLVPLQYIDLDNKTQLTCFMLPQIGPRSTMKYESSDASCAANVNYSENDRTESKRGIHTNANYSKHICFAEEATVVTAPPVINNSINESSIASMPIEPEPFEVRLLRSPTPYPKELRLMAKYLRTGLNDNGQLKNPHDFRENSDVTPAVLQSQMYLMNETNQDYVQHKVHPTNINYGTIEQARYFSNEVDQIQNSSIIGATKNGEYNLESQTYPKLYDDWNNDENVVNQLTQNHVQHQLFLANNLHTQTILPGSPPPYHIARSFTKKSPEDLTQYDVLSQQLLTNSNDFSEGEARTNTKSHHSSPSPIEESSNNYLDHENNNVNENQTQHKDSLNLTNEQCNLQCSSRHAASSETTLSNSLIPKGTDENAPVPNKTPWLFGTHKNPTVKQISLKWNHQLGFEITKFENQDGIYVASITSNTNAAKLLCYRDKLLEVDGCDFTKISLNDARRVLANSASVLNIMISRI